MGYKPDYGLRLMNEGIPSDVDCFFYDFHLFSLTVLSRGQYSTMVEQPCAGEWHALSLDFNQQQLDQILSKATPQLAAFLRRELTRDPSSPRTINFEGEVAFGVRARLGQLQKLQREAFVPFVVQEILPTEPAAVHDLERARIELDQIAQVGVSLFAAAGEAPLVISGECYAYELDRLSVNQHQPWHWTLMRAALMALAALRAKMPVLAAYELRAGLVRFFLCANDLRMKSSTHALLASVPGYVECGYDALPLGHMRPVAYWAPPATLAALWPLPLDARPGPYAIHAGNLLQFRSYPEADHDEGLALDLAGPDYLRLPIHAEGRLDPEGVSYVNRWAELVYPDPTRYR